MIDIDDGGAAFPVHGQSVDFGDGWIEQQNGMSRRDWLAGMAMQGLCSGGTKGDSLELIAKLSFRMADAMIAAGKVKS